MSERRFCRSPGGVCWLGLHLVWWPNYRCRVLSGRIARRLGDLIVQLTAERGRQIVATEVMPDHVHLLVRVGPTDAPAQVVWSPSYAAAPVGYVWESTVRRDIEQQWDAVMAW